jgi:periplasmic protein TonB
MNYPKAFVCISACIILSSSAFCQAESDNSNSASGTATRAVMQADAQPKFIGNWNKFLDKNLRYPEKSQELRQEGRTVVQFTVLETGLIDNIQIKESSGSKLLDEEALRVTRLMQTKAYWKPGRKNGVEVRAFFKVPVTFKLED